jgi:hypothetical protein
MALSYLQDGASGFFGSTTIAYGPSEGNGSADLICQYFLQQVLAGASLGRAALEARLKFGGGKTHLDPYDLKTLAQFYLLGDPSLHPVAPVGHALTKTKAFRQAFADTRDRTVRQLRRERMVRDARCLEQMMPRLKPAQGVAPSGGVEKALRAMAKESGLEQGVDRMHFELQAPGRAARKAGAPGRRLIHVIAQRRPVPGEAVTIKRIVALVATEEEGQLIHVRRLHAR